MSLLTSMFSFPKEVYRKRNYTVLNVELKEFQTYDVEGDFLAVLYSNADITKVYIGFNTQDPIIPLNIVSSGVITPFSRLYIKCESSEVGKKIIFIIGQEAKFTISTQGIIIQSDNVGLAKETTLSAIRDRLPSSLTASGNLRIAILETTIKQPIDIQDHWQESVTLLPSAARTTSGNTADIDVGRFICAEICLDVTSVSGTSPTLDVYIEGKDQVSGKYKVLFSQTGITAVGTYWFTITTLAFKYLRVRWVIGGTTPSFTFSVGMEAKS